MSVYNLSPLPFVRSAPPPHSRSSLRATGPAVRLPRRPFQASSYARCVRGIGLSRLKSAVTMRLPRANPFVHQSA